MIHSGLVQAAREPDLPADGNGSQQRAVSRSVLAGPLPLFAVLVLQVLLATRLIWSNTAFQDEALYLWAGHLEWSGWLHGSPAGLAFQSYFSGAPVIYPPLAALADNVAGLAGARLLSLGFMLGTTALLWSVTRRLFDDRAAAFAIVAFAGTAAAQFVSALATYDAMALMLLAAATWCAVRSADCRRRGQALLLTAMVALLALANATKYGSLLWDPVVVVLAALADGRHRGRLSGLLTGAASIAALATVLLAALAAAGRGYLTGLMASTLSRPAGQNAPFAVLQNAGYWIGAVAALAVLGAVILTRAGAGRALTLTGWTLAAAVLLAPIEQARIHTDVSLFKHVGYGGWFAAIIAGYGLAALTLPVRAATARRVVAGLAAVTLAAMGITGAVAATDHYDDWENAATLTAALSPLVAESHGPALAEEPSVLSYYFRKSDLIWSSTFVFTYTDPATAAYLTGIPAYTAAIGQHYFSLIVIGFTTTTIAADRAIARAVRQNRGYHLMASVPWSSGPHSGHYLIWRYQPGTGGG